MQAYINEISCDILKLNKFVNEKIKLGYTPIGGITFIKGKHDSFDNAYIQSMYKPKVTNASAT